jgi:hypothetical protein
MLQEPGFGDRVRIAHDPATGERGFAGREGEIHGESIPSVSGVAVIGDGGEDRAFSVYFDDSGEQAWFAVHLVELVRYGEPGQEMRFDDGPTFVRDEVGGWSQVGGPTELGDVLKPAPLSQRPPDAERTIMRWLRSLRGRGSSGD